MAKRSYRFPNGYGSVYKQNGNRRNPWIAVKTIGWKVVDGKKKQVKKVIGSYPTEAKAVAGLEEFNNGGFSTDANKYTFGDLYVLWSEVKYSKLSKSAVKGYKAAYKRFDKLSLMKMKDIRTQHLQELLDNSDMSPNIKQTAKSIMLGVYSLAMQNDIVKKDYSKYVDVGKKSESKPKIPFTLDEINKLWENVSVPSVDSILMLIYTGLRCSELLQLTVKDVDLENRMIIGGLKTPSGKNRSVPIHKDVLPLFEARCQNKKYLFLNTRGRKMSYETYTGEHWATIMESLGMDHTTHDCRHTFATICDKCKIDLLTQKLIMGHKVTDVTGGIYIHRTNEDLLKAIDDFRLC